MSIRVKKERNGKHTVSLVMSKRVPGKPYPVNVTVLSFGILEELVKKEPNVLERLKNEYSVKNLHEQTLIPFSFSENSDLKNSYLKDLDKTLFEANDAKSNPNSNKSNDVIINNPVLNIGYLLLTKVFNKLQLNTFFDSIASYYKIEYNLTNAVKLAVFSRILYPDNICQNYLGQKKFLESFGIELHDAYRCLDIVYKHREELIKHLFEEVSKLRDSELQTIIFDETNYYFSQEEPSGLKQKGVSKEHQLTPIIQFALMVDEDGLPLNFDIFPGNTKDSKMMPPLMETVKTTFQQKQQLTFIADKGNNCGENIILIDNNKDKYVFSQRVRGANKEFSDWVIKQEGYIQFGEDYKYKFRKHTSNYSKQVKDENGKYKIVETKTVEELQVAFWSRKFAERDIAKRRKSVESSEQAIENPGFSYMENAKGKAKYVKPLEKPTLVLNVEKIEKDSLYDGYYAIISNDTTLEATDLINTYCKETTIESVNKITKSLLKFRPVFVWLPEHISAHFSIGYIALVMLNIIHKQVIDALIASGVKKEEASFSHERIQDALKKFVVIDETHDVFRLGEVTKDTIILAKVYKILLFQRNYRKDQIFNLFGVEQMIV
jgi:hypothetical protein